MSIKLSKSELWKAIQGVGKVVFCKETKPILHHVRLKSHEGAASITGTTIDELIIYKFKTAECSGTNDFLIMLEELKKFVKDESEGSIVFQPGTDNMVEAVMETNGKRQVRLFKTEKLEDWPKELHFVENMERVPASVFYWIRAVIPSAAKPEDSRRTLESVYLESSGMTATDGKQLAHAEYPLPVSEMVVPVTKILSSRLFDQDGAMGTASYKEKKYLCVRCDRFTYIVKCRLESFPNYKQVIPKDKDLRMNVEFRESTLKEIRKCINLLPVKGDQENVILYAGKHGVHIFSDDDKAPSVLNTDGVASSPEDCFVKFNRNMFFRALDMNYLDVTPYKLCLHFGDNTAVVAKGIYPAYLVFMPFRGVIINKEKFLSLIKDRTNPVKEKAVKTRTATVEPAAVKTEATEPTQKETTGFQVVGHPQENGEVFEEASSAIETLKSSIKAIYDGVASLQRKLKDAQKAIKNKEREYLSTKQLITKLRTASGF